ncbi:hypothetical protein [Microtetraspora malaysiensis]|uniref:hypothetical protein n=1 Tax=Microtetraspora malaysiensis TaxID=161358 RepID=UPI003D8B7214
MAALFPVGMRYRDLGTAVVTCRPGMGSGRAAAPLSTSRPRAVPCAPVGMIGSGTAQAERTWVGLAVTGGPVGMLPPMAGTLVLIAKVLVVMAGAPPPTAETLMQAALAVAARLVLARMLLVVIAG